jgi:hypothetical protein
VLLPSFLMPLPRSPTVSQAAGPLAGIVTDPHAGNNSNNKKRSQQYSVAGSGHTSRQVVVPSGILPRGYGDGLSVSSPTPTSNSRVAHNPMSSPTGGGSDVVVVGGVGGRQIELMETARSPKPSNTDGLASNIFLALGASSGDLVPLSNEREQLRAAHSATALSSSTPPSSFDRSESTDAVRAAHHNDDHVHRYPSRSHQNPRGEYVDDGAGGISGSTLDRASAARDLSAYTGVGAVHAGAGAGAGDGYNEDDDREEELLEDEQQEKPRSISTFGGGATGGFYGLPTLLDEHTMDARDRALGRYCGCLCRRRASRLSTRLPASSEEVVILPLWARKRCCSEQLFASVLLFMAVVLAVLSVAMQIVVSAQAAAANRVDGR